MMRWFPASLFGRLMVVFLVVLLAAQFISAAILLRDRGAVVYEASGFHTAQRIADVVQLLEALPRDQRGVVLRAVNSTSFGVSEVMTPGLAETTDVHAAHLRQLLHRALADERRLIVAVTHVDAIDPDESMNVSHYPATTTHCAAFAVQLPLRDGQWVVFTQRLPPEQFTWPARLLAALGILLAAVLLVSFIAVRWITRPLAALSQAADGLGRDLRRAPLPETGPRETRLAAQAFNAMQSRLRGYLQDRERLLAAVSHDLKTPITRLRLRAELLTDETLKEKFVRDLGEMESMAAATLEFMQTAYDGEALQLMDINALLESMQADREEMGQSVMVEGQAYAPYPVKPIALKRALANLIDNAIKYGVRPVIRVEDSATQLSIVVADEGPGIPESLMEQVFEPFCRLEPSRSRETGGAGLGLSIARDIVHSHRGELVLRNRSIGGLEAILRLPR
ncbi:MAG: HAMP domain-containing protein [Gammaproteobacteria bacterium]|nr:HAMP domain-containing protein [Gammaproteobacteria bacterium]